MVLFCSAARSVQRCRSRFVAAAWLVGSSSQPQHRGQLQKAAGRSMSSSSATSPAAGVQASSRWPGQSFACDSSQRSRAWNRSGVQQTGVRTACAVPDSSCSGCSWWWACASLSGTAQLSASMVVVKACTRYSSEDLGSATGRYWRLEWPILGLFELPMYQRFMKHG